MREELTKLQDELTKILKTSIFVHTNPAISGLLQKNEYGI
jgi:hypothetical protein